MSGPSHSERTTWYIDYATSITHIVRNLDNEHVQAISFLARKV